MTFSSRQAAGATGSASRAYGVLGKGMHAGLPGSRLCAHRGSRDRALVRRVPVHAPVHRRADPAGPRAPGQLASSRRVPRLSADTTTNGICAISDGGGSLRCAARPPPSFGQHGLRCPPRPASGTPPYRIPGATAPDSRSRPVRQHDGHASHGNLRRVLPGRPAQATRHDRDHSRDRLNPSPRPIARALGRRAYWITVIKP